MAGAVLIKQLLLERSMTIKELADKLNLTHQNMRNKLYRDTFTFKEMKVIADILECDIEIVTRDTKKVFK